MVSKVISAAPVGYDAEIIEVESDASNGLPSLQIVGMGNKSIDESKERVRSAIRNSLLDFPTKKIMVNLAPAEIPKDGAHLDLPIAISILVLSGQLKQSEIIKCGFAGELSLNGEVRAVRGILNIVEKLKAEGIENIFIPKSNIPQMELIDGVNIFGIKSLKELFLHLKKEITLSAAIRSTTKQPLDAKQEVAFKGIIGQEQAKRALTIAIVGRHNILLNGPPGTGKTMLAHSALNLLPELTDEECLQVARIHGLVNSSGDQNSRIRPFRTPHHTASLASIIGGGPKASPGEISLAHLGVLFLDELPEYPRSTLESLRQPLEDKKITISRTKRNNTYPADFMLIATMNPCPCGYYGDIARQCTCTTSQILNYKKRLSGPLIDRIDLSVTVSRLENMDLLSQSESVEGGEDLYDKQIKTSLKLQHKRFDCSNHYNSTANLSTAKRLFRVDDQAKELLSLASKKLDLSARSYLKTLRVSRTIADLEGSEKVNVAHINEALQYRQ